MKHIIWNIYLFCFCDVKHCCKYILHEWQISPDHTHYNKQLCKIRHL